MAGPELYVITKFDGFKIRKDGKLQNNKQKCQNKDQTVENW